MGTTTVVMYESQPVLVLTADDLVGVMIFLFLGFFAFGFYRLLKDIYR